MKDAAAQAVAASGVACCRLPPEWRGGTATTLLAARADLLKLATALVGLGFKRVTTARGGEWPETFYYGYAPDQSFVRLRLDHRVLVGGARAFCLPLASDCLADQQPGVLGDPPPTPAFVAELISTVLRDDRTGVSMPPGGDVGRTQVTALLERRLPFINPEAFWAGSARELRRTLRDHAVPGHTSALVPAAGGTLIAVVGGDGSGKTTAVAALHTWLSSDFRATRVHLGKPPRSLTTHFTRAVLKAWNALCRGSADEQFARSLRNLCASRDRVLAYRQARRKANRGTLVICDRYPLSNLTRMDAPEPAAAGEGRLLSWLRRREASWYAAVAPADLTLVLQVPPEVAVRRALARGTKENAELVRSRSAEVWQADWRGLPVTLVDASPAQDDVLAQIKALVWTHL